MTADGFPPLDLELIFAWQASTHMVAAIPLEPTARVVLLIDPAFFLPHLEWLTGMLMKKVERVIVMFGRQLGASEPAFRKLFPAVGHVLAAKYAKCEHFPGGEFRFETRVKVSSYRLGEVVLVTPLKFVVHCYGLFCYGCLYGCLIENPNSVVQICGETYPKDIWRKKPSGWFGNFIKGNHRGEDGKPEEYNLHERTTRAVQAEEDNRPKCIQNQLAEEYTKSDFDISAI